ncbi:MAG TPA: lysine transporter LysE [Micromonosporaceae bacterium]|nr:lysine transporter LysE [Micromonosporaceae bacterium]HCU50759.1 lysine transporter LysE [Micromonosporaceae bacterium]
MVSWVAVLSIALVAVGLVLTPGPNTIYLVSRTVAQGRSAGLVSLLGIATGFFVYLLGSAAGLTTLLNTVPFLYDGVRLLGAAYLAWLAWQAWHSGREPEISVQPALPVSSPIRLYLMGLATNLLNPTIAILYLSLLPQFIDSARGNVALQGVILGSVQIVVTVALNCLIVLAAGRIGPWLTDRPRWGRVQRWLTATVLGALAVRIISS